MKNKNQNTNCNSREPNESVDKGIKKILPGKKDKTDRLTQKGVPDDAPFSTAEYVMVKPGYEDDEINTQGS